jgi:hypothetical protein
VTIVETICLNHRSPRGTPRGFLFQKCMSLFSARKRGRAGDVGRRVERWRGSLGLAQRFPALSPAGASLAWPCPCPPPAHQTGRAQLRHPAFGQGNTRSLTGSYVSSLRYRNAAENRENPAPGPYAPRIATDGPTDDVAVHLSVGCPANSPTHFYTPSGRTTHGNDQAIPSLRRAMPPAASEPLVELIGFAIAYTLECSRTVTPARRRRDASAGSPVHFVPRGDVD